MILIKELISEVLEIEIVDYSISENQVRINQLWHEDNPLNRELELFNTSYGCKVSINIYELAHKCKEWAYNDKSLCGYSIELKSYKSEIGYWLCELMSEDITFSGDTEPEAIFKACQWILDNK